MFQQRKFYLHYSLECTAFKHNIDIVGKVPTANSDTVKPHLNVHFVFPLQHYKDVFHTLQIRLHHAFDIRNKKKIIF